MADVDLDGSNTLDFDEFLTGRRGLASGPQISMTKSHRQRAAVPLLCSRLVVSLTTRVSECCSPRLAVLSHNLPATVFLGKLERRELLLTAFQHFDQDGSGFITEAELVEALRKHNMPEDQLQELLAAVDHDGDDRIDYDEARGSASFSGQGGSAGGGGWSGGALIPFGRRWPACDTPSPVSRWTVSRVSTDT
jgi:uncharacterized membrane protein YgcG